MNRFRWDKLLTLVFILATACTEIPLPKHKVSEHCKHCARNDGVDSTCVHICMGKRQEMIHRKAPQTAWPMGWVACNACLRWKSQDKACYSKGCFDRCSIKEERKGVPRPFLVRMSILNKPCKQ